MATTTLDTSDEDPDVAEKKGPLYAEHDIGKLKVLQTTNDTMAKKYAMSVMAASVAEFVTYPLDLTKTRLLKSLVDCYQ